MDIETAEAVDGLRSDIGRVGRDVTRVETSLTAKIQDVETSLNEKIQDVETSLTAKIDHVETSLTAKMDEHKRHADIRRESMHDDIRLLAESLASLGVEVRTLRR